MKYFRKYFIWSIYHIHDEKNVLDLNNSLHLLRRKYKRWTFVNNWVSEVVNIYILGWYKAGFTVSASGLQSTRYSRRGLELENDM